MSGPMTFELLQWHAPTVAKPDSDITVACWTDTDGFFAGWWSDAEGAWIDAASGFRVKDQAVAWANPKGPAAQRIVPTADVPAEQVRGALAEALEQLRGWVAWKCPKRHQAEHLAAVGALERAGGLR